jgi:hypothetical protein
MSDGIIINGGVTSTMEIAVGSSVNGANISGAG